MSIPFNPSLSWTSFKVNPGWYVYEDLPKGSERKNQASRAVNEVAVQTFKQFFSRGVQFVRDTLRLVLKVPFRSLRTPIFLSKNWKECERAKINCKLTGYSFVQLTLVPVKFAVALAALMTSAVSMEKAKKMLDASQGWSDFLDGRASQLEALKEVGRVHARDYTEFNGYREWLYEINPILCRAPIAKA